MVLLNVPLKQEPTNKLGRCSNGSDNHAGGADFGLESCLLEHLHIPASFPLF